MSDMEYQVNYIHIEHSDSGLEISRINWLAAAMFLSWIFLNCW